MNPRLVSLIHSASFEGEQYRVLRHSVEERGQDARVRVIAVTSPVGGDGKTTTAINLAGALAQTAGARVLLVDVDFRRPSVARALGLATRGAGLEDALQASDVALDDLVKPLPRFNLSVLPARGGTAAPYEALKSPRLDALLQEAATRYDHIVLDTPPFIPVPDCRLITRCVGGFLIVVAAHRTPRRALAETLSLLDPEKVVGLVFNGADVGRSTYYYDVYAGAPRTTLWQRFAQQATRLHEAWARPEDPRTP